MVQSRSPSRADRDLPGELLWREVVIHCLTLLRLTLAEQLRQPCDVNRDQPPSFAIDMR
jgi:hypothetical protein